MSGGLYEPFWEACRQGRLVFLKCGECGSLLPYARVICPDCGGTALQWQPVSGRGRVYSFSVIRRPAGPEFRPYAPYVLALIELEEGVRMMSWVVGCPPEQVQVDMPVQVVFRDLGGWPAVPCFAPAQVAAVEGAAAMAGRVGRDQRG